MSDDGKGDWRNRTDLHDPDRPITGAELSLAPVFWAEVFKDDDQWTGTLNGEKVSFYPTIDQAKARIDWEIWNRLRQITDGFAKILARKSTWEKGSSSYPLRAQL